MDFRKNLPLKEKTKQERLHSEGGEGADHGRVVFGCLAVGSSDDCLASVRTCSVN